MHSSIERTFAAFGDGMRRAIAESLREGEDAAQVPAPERLKFLSEALIATAVDGPASRDLHRQLVARLFGRAALATVHANPLTLASYAMPIAFAGADCPAAVRIRALYMQLYRRRAVRMSSYPEYRNVEMD